MRRRRRLRRLTEPVFELLAVHEPLARIVKRDPTLDGSVPLRVAQACVPLLEGNALGHQLAFRKRLVARTRLGKRGFAAGDALEEIDRAHRAAVPLLVARGHLARGGAWHARLEKGWWWTERGVLRAWTGLLVRPRPGTWLRVSGPGSRAPQGVRVRPTYVGSGAFVPLVVDFETLEDGARLEGEVANLTPVVPAVRASVVDLADAPAPMEAHARFYDAKYFATKKGEVTRKYRRTVARRDDEPTSPSTATSPIRIRVVHVAGPRAAIVGVDRVLGAGDTSPVTALAGERLDVVQFANAVPFTAHFDGNTLDIAPDRAALARGARAVEAATAAALGDAFVTTNRGALLYLTKYFTPHPHGEPHFFVKPWAFTETPRGWSSVIDGVRGDGYDVMRGVVWTDRFHATPAVFNLPAGRRVRVPEGAPLIEVIAIPRALLAEEPRVIEEPTA